MEVQGIIKLIGETETFGNDFTKCNVVITTEEQYPQHLQIEFVKDKIALLSSYKIGDSVKIGINLRGREWVNPEGVSKYFNSIQGWNINKAEGTAQPLADAPTTPIAEEEHDDLPF